MTAGSRLALWCCSAVCEVVVWAVLVPITLARIAAGRAAMSELGARLGSSGPLAGPHHRGGTAGTRVVVHAVSAGEMASARPLATRLAAAGCRVLLTTGTRAGMTVAVRIARAHPGIEGCVYLPWDRGRTRRWLRDTAPGALVIVETELWPNLFAACGDLGIPLFVASGRIRPADVPRYRLARWWFSRLFDAAAWIGAQTTGDRERFVAIGAPAGRVEIAGSLKFDAAVEGPRTIATLEADPAGRPLVVAGSTHHPEEGWLLECAALLARRGRPIRLVIAPRDVGRAGRIASLAGRRGFAATVWSTLESPPGQAARRRPVAPGRAGWDVLVLDRHGELASFYPLADVVFVGGTLAPIGGHNVLEAAVAGRPIVVGPHVAQIDDLVARLEAGGGIMRVAGADPGRGLLDACLTLLAHPDRARTLGSKARQICRSGIGAADRCADVVLAAAGLTAGARRPASAAARPSLAS